MIKAEEYADKRLETLRPDIAADNYSRSRKMSLNVFDGLEVESAYEEGYKQAIEDINKTLKEAQEKYNKKGEESDAMQDEYGMYWGGVHCAFNTALNLIDELKKQNYE